MINREQIMNHVDAHGVTVRERINQALTETLPDIGQIDPVTKRQLNRLVREGYLSKGRGGIAVNTCGRQCTWLTWTASQRMKGDGARAMRMTM